MWSRESWCCCVMSHQSVFTMSSSDRFLIKAAPFHSISFLLNRSHFRQCFFPTPILMALEQGNMTGLVLCYFALCQWCRKMTQDVTHRYQYPRPHKLCFTQYLCGLFSLLRLNEGEEANAYMEGWGNEGLAVYCMSFLFLKRTYCMSVMYSPFTVRNLKKTPFWTKHLQMSLFVSLSIC